MFSGIPQKNRAVAESYFDEHLSDNDYYTQGEKQTGHWIGTAAEKLGLQQGEVVWNGADPEAAGPVQKLSGQKPDQAVWLKRVDPAEREGEQYQVYEQLLAGSGGRTPALRRAG